VAEVVALLADRGAHPLAAGPLSGEAGVAWVGVDDTPAAAVAARLAPLGYSGSVELVRPLAEVADPDPAWTRARWRRRDVVLEPVWAEPDGALRAGAPDRRPFLLECGDGVVRRIDGYRGGPGPREHRALPVADARLLVNLVASPGRGSLLDPFAGAGGVVIAARAAGWRAGAVDVDPRLRHGLAELADHHVVGDAAALPLAAGSVDAVATEPPYDPDATGIVAAAMAEVARVLRPGGRAALLVAVAQAAAVAAAGERAGLAPGLRAPIDRRGTPVACLTFRAGQRLRR
jgi:SAM-dependent methyltransferase